MNASPVNPYGVALAVIDGHEVYPTSAHDEHTRRLLAELEAGNGLSQRSLSKNLGIALGLTNLLVRRLVRKGWVRVVRIKPNRVKYLITPTGILEKARISRRYFNASIRFYSETRDRVRYSFATLSATFPSECREKRVVFYGAGEVAEIGFVCLQETDLRLVGVVDTDGPRTFFGMRVAAPSALRNRELDGRAFDKLIVMSFGEPETIDAELRQRAITGEQVFWI